MYCSKCGTLNNGNNYCYNCGNSMNLNSNQLGSVTIIRPKSFFGCAVAYKIYIDNCYMGSISNGNSAQYLVGYGNHIIEIQQGINNGKSSFFINDREKNIVLECPIKMGLLTNNIEFNLINYYN